MSYNNNSQMYEGYIYRITNIINNKSYIGQTTTTVEHRIGQHFSKSRKESCRILKNAINKYGKENFKYETLISISENTKKCLCERLNELEIMYINDNNTLFPNGYNISKGGNNHECLGNSVDVYDKNGILIKTFKTCVEAADFAKINVETVCDICNGNQHKSTNTDYIFRYVGDEFYKYDPFTTGRQYKIYQFMPNGDFVRKYNNAQEVLDYYSDIKPQGVIGAVGKNGFYYGYYWTKNNYFDFDIDNYKKWHPVDQYSTDGVLLKRWNSITEALNNIGFNCGSRILLQCEGKIITPVCGYIWRNKDDLYNKYSVNMESKKRKQPIDQYSINGEFIASYDTIKEAGYSNNISEEYHSHISACCKGKKSYALGYVWRYKGDSYDKYNVNTEHYIRRQVDQYSTDGTFIKTYNTVKEAANSCGKSDEYLSHITKVCQHKSNSAFGYVWRYHGEPFGKYIEDRKCVRINKYTIDDVFVDSYSKITEAAKTIKTDICYKSIASSICKKTKSKDHCVYGFKWYMSDDPDQPDSTKIFIS